MPATTSTPEPQVARLRPAVRMIRPQPADSDYLWPDAEGLTAELVMLATSVTARYAEHALTLGDIDGCSGPPVSVYR